MVSDMFLARLRSSQTTIRELAARRSRPLVRSSTVISTIENERNYECERNG
jgi:hypothetical protein